MKQQIRIRRDGETVVMIVERWDEAADAEGDYRLPIDRTQMTLLLTKQDLANLYHNMGELLLNERGRFQVTL